MASKSHLVRLKPSQSTSYKFRRTRNWSFIQVIAISNHPNPSIEIMRWLIVTRCHLTHFYIKQAVNISIFTTLLNCWDVRVLFLKSRCLISLLHSFCLFSVLLVLFPDLCYFSVNLRVHVKLLVLDWVQRFVIWTDSISYFVPLVAACVNFASLTVLVSQIHVHIHWWHSLHSETCAGSILFLILVRRNMSQSVCVFITSLDSQILDDTLVKLWIFHIVTLNWSILMKSCVVWIVFWVSKVSLILFVGRSTHFLRRGVNSFIPTPLNSFWGRVRRSDLKNLASLHRNRTIFPTLTLKFS